MFEQGLVMATHLSLGQVGGFYAEAHPRAEPIVVAPIGRVPDSMYISAYISADQPSHYIRTRKQNGEVFGIVAGPSFMPGDTEEERKSFEGNRALADRRQR